MAKKESTRRVATLGRAKPARQRNRSGAVEVREITGTRAVDKILPRHWPPIRAYRPLHAIGLAASIHERGLVEPIVIDADGKLLAGAHRLGACRILAASEGERAVAMLDAMEELSRPGAKPPAAKSWSEALSAVPLGTGALSALAVPVRIFPFRSSEDRVQAHKIEVAENEHREDMTRKELATYKDFLEETGEFTFSQGRPKKGQKSGYQEMSATTGIAPRTLRSWLGGTKSGRPAAFSQSDQREHDIKKLRETAQRVMKRHSDQLDKATRDAIEIMLAHLDRA